MPKLTSEQKTVRQDRATLDENLRAMETAPTTTQKAMAAAMAELILTKPAMKPGIKLRYTPHLPEIANELRKARQSGAYDGAGTFDDFDTALAKAAAKHGVEPASIPPMTQARLKKLI